MSDCLFCRIITREIPGQIVFEDDDLLAFRDINPQAPLHVLIVPKKHIATLNDLTPATMRWWDRCSGEPRRWRTSTVTANAGTAVGRQAVRGGEATEATDGVEPRRVVATVLGRAQRRPHLAGDREVPQRSTRRCHVEVDECDDPAVPEDDVLREEVVVADDRPADRIGPLRRPAGRTRLVEAGRGVVEPAHEPAEVVHRLVAQRPCGVRRVGHVATHVREHVPTELVDA